MIWQSNILMTLIDLFIMSTGIYVGYRMHRNHKLNPMLKGSYHRLLIGAGLFLITIFFVADLITMWILPQFIGMESALTSMEYLHLNISWFINPLALFLIAAGFLSSETELTQYQSNLEKLVQERTEELSNAMQEAKNANPGQN